jgi:hypothetical protein
MYVEKKKRLIISSESTPCFFKCHYCSFLSVDGGTWERQLKKGLGVVDSPRGPKETQNAREPNQGPRSHSEACIDPFRWPVKWQPSDEALGFHSSVYKPAHNPASKTLAARTPTSTWPPRRRRLAPRDRSTAAATMVTSPSTPPRCFSVCRWFCIVS